MCFSLGLTPLAQSQSDTSREEATVVTQSVDSEAPGPFEFMKIFSGNPGKAALYSAILPGAGQLYNKNYWKIPIALAAEGTAIGFLIFNQRAYTRWKNAHLGFVNGTIQIPYRGATTASQARSQRDRFKQLRDQTIIATVAVHLIQVADAFIHRHLIEFDVSDDLSFMVSPGKVGISLSLR